MAACQCRLNNTAACQRRPRVSVNNIIVIEPTLTRGHSYGCVIEPTLTRGHSYGCVIERTAIAVCCSVGSITQPRVSVGRVSVNNVIEPTLTRCHSYGCVIVRTAIAVAAVIIGLSAYGGAGFFNHSGMMMWSWRSRSDCLNLIITNVMWDCAL